MNSHPDQWNEISVSPLQKNRPGKNALTKKTNKYKGNHNMAANKSTSSFVSDAVDGLVFGDHALHHSIAPTLPIHSPMSPLLTDETNFQHLKDNKLSARYINNTMFLRKTKKSPMHDDTKLRSTNTSLSLNLICYHEKNEVESLERPGDNISLDSSIAKRLVPTRNAATSTHLYDRKLCGMNTIIPSASLTSELCETICCKTKESTNLTCDDIIFGGKRNHKATSQNKKSVAEPKPTDVLRMTRSLSPRPPIRNRNDALLPHSNNENKRFFYLPKANTYTNKKEIIKLCRSEQASPNITDGTKTQFFYNDLPNSNTCGLGNELTKYWSKSICSSNKLSSFILIDNEEKIINTGNAEAVNHEDPWIKRADIEDISKVSKHDLFRQSKSLSISKFDLQPVVKDSSLVNENKCLGNLNTETNPAPLITSNTRNKLQSAPTSPQLLTTTENIFSSSTYRTTRQTFSSFSPARTKDNRNPFGEYNLQFLNSPSTSILGGAKQQKDMSKTHPRVDFLNVCKQNVLITRHSFSSVSDQKQGEELQLNIRRLSDQMSQKEAGFTKNIHIFSSDRIEHGKKVIKSPTDISNTTTFTKVTIKSSAFSEYLEEFRCFKANRAVIDNEKSCLWRQKLSMKMPNNKANAMSETQQSPDCLLETTC